MRITATVHHEPGRHEVTVATDGRTTTLDLPARDGGPGSAVNGGELLAAALATCFLNDLHREAGRRGIEIGTVEVVVESEYGGRGEPARDLTYEVHVRSRANAGLVADLVRETDLLAEVHATLRAAREVELRSVQISAP
ncbi:MULTISPECIES: OsmC family protein [Aeromicrobium]|uniref:OsmC family protein n=1 Tax=Aeromicrobium TaxID=2040 RepID=UPI00257AE57F|nr:MULTISPECIES: OsmC family protein [Aeromicrobium]